MTLARWETLLKLCKFFCVYYKNGSMREKSCLPRSVFFTFIFVIHNLHKESRDHLFSFKNLDDAIQLNESSNNNALFFFWMKEMTKMGFHFWYQFSSLIQVHRNIELIEYHKKFVLIDNIYFKWLRLWFQTFVVCNTLRCASSKEVEHINCSLISSYN